MTDSIIDKAYPEARSNFDARVAAFREHLKAPGHFLYVHICEDFPSPGSVRKAIDLFGARNPDHRFHFLFCGFPEQDSDLSELEAEGWVTKIPRVEESFKPVGREFEGNDAAWDIGFDQFRLVVPERPPKRDFIAEAEMAAKHAPLPPLPEPERGRLLSRLFGGRK